MWFPLSLFEISPAPGRSRTQDLRILGIAVDADLTYGYACHDGDSGTCLEIREELACFAVALGVRGNGPLEHVETAHCVGELNQPTLERCRAVIWRGYLKKPTAANMAIADGSKLGNGPIAWRWDLRQVLIAGPSQPVRSGDPRDRLTCRELIWQEQRD